MPNPKYTKAQIKQQEIDVLRLRSEGRSLRAVAEILGMDHTVVRDREIAALKSIKLPERDEAIRAMFERLDVLYDSMVAQDTPQAAAVAMKIEDHRAKLLGLYAAQKVEVTHYEAGTVEEEIAKLQAEMGMPTVVVLP